MEQEKLSIICVKVLVKRKWGDESAELGGIHDKK